jgi:hypothetical protein
MNDQKPSQSSILKSTRFNLALPVSTIVDILGCFYNHFLVVETSYARREEHVFNLFVNG